jgi:nitrate reductase gamma subunit
MRLVIMEWYKYSALIAASICLATFLYRLIYLISLGLPKDLSKESGSVTKGIIYSFTGAMSPKEKESAYLHLPTYTAGVVFHLGIFSALLFFIWTVFTLVISVETPELLSVVLIILLTLSALSGISILLKRVFSEELRYLSCADDYISNILSTSALIATIILLTVNNSEALYFIIMTTLFLWMPLGKTKHLLYFFFARLHLGFFYGRRGAWPKAKNRDYEIS